LVGRKERGAIEIRVACGIAEGWEDIVRVYATTGSVPCVGAKSGETVSVGKYAGKYQRVMNMNVKVGLQITKNHDQSR